MKRIYLIIALLFVVLLTSCAYTPQFVKGENYVIEGEYTSMHTDNGNYVYIVGGNTIVLGNKQEQPNMVVGHVYKIVWKMVSVDVPQVIEILSVEDKGTK